MLVGALLDRLPRIPARLLGLLAAAPIVLAACAPGSATPGQSQEAAPPARQTKTLRIGTIKEPSQGLAVAPGAAGNIAGGGAQQHAWIFHQGLTTFDGQGNLQPAVASKVPSIADGDWKLNADGTMDVTWKLRPNVKWHDGTTLSAEDFVFAIPVANDPVIPLSRAAGSKLVKEVTAPDAQTLVVHWSEPFYGANRGGPYSVPAVPRHIMQEPYLQGDKQAFSNSLYWTTQFVGLGPYRLGDWVQGSFAEALAFDDYFLGRPMIDRQTFADTFEPGGSAPADLFVSADDPAYRLTEQRGFTRLAYDPAQAMRLLADAGWTRGSDGTVQNPAGQKFTMETRVIQRA